MKKVCIGIQLRWKKRLTWAEDLDLSFPDYFPEHITENFPNNHKIRSVLLGLKMPTSIGRIVLNLESVCAI